MAEGFKIASAWVEVSPDLEGFKEKLKAELDSATSGVEAKVKVGIDSAKFDADADKIRAKADELSARAASIKVGLDDEASGRLDEIHARLAEISNSTHNAKVALEQDVTEKLEEIRAELDARDGKTARPRAKLDDAELKAKVAEDLTLLEMLGAKASNVTSSLGGGLGGLASSMWFPKVYGITGAIGSILPGISAATAGFGMLGGAGAMAFGGVIQAVMAHSQAMQATGITGAQMAATSFSNAVAVQQAQQQVSAAFMQQAQDAKTSAMTVMQAEQQVTLSEQSLRDAQFNEAQAQYNLTQARIQARITLQQLNDAEKDSILSTRAAKLSLAQAEYQQKLTDQNAMSTLLDKQQAALAVAQAQRGVIEAEQNQANSAAAAARANKLGVEGSQQVVLAKHALIDAVNQVRDAEIQASDAVKQAALAQETAAYQAKRDAIAVAQAQQNVTNTIKEQRLQWAAMMASSNQGMNQFAKDMSRLSAPARALVEQFLQFHTVIKQWETTAQGAIAPGITAFLRSLRADAPIITRAIGQMGHAISDSFSQFAKMMTTPAFKTGLTGLFTQGQRFISIFLPAVARLLQELGKIGGQNGVGAGFAKLLGGIVDLITNAMKGIAPYMGAISGSLGIIGQAIGDLGQPVGQIIGVLGQTLFPLLKAMLPQWKLFVDTLGKSLIIALKALVPSMIPLSQALAETMKAAAPLLIVLGELTGQIAEYLAPIISKLLVPALTWLSKVLAPVLDHMTKVLKPTQSWNTLLAGLPFTLKDVVDAVAKVGTAVFTMWHDVTNYFSGLQNDWQSFATWAQGLWTTFTGWISNQIGLWLSSIDGSFKSGVKGLSRTWNTLKQDFKGPVDFLINTVYDKGIARLWNDVVKAVGQGSLALPLISGYAAGGVVPGYAPGRDTRLAAVSPGEGILIPEAVRGLGGPAVIHGLNNAFNSRGGASRTASGAAVPAFANGGVLGGLGGVLGGIGSAISGGASFIASLLTNPVAAVEKLLGRVVKTTGTGGYGALLTALPKALIRDLGNALRGKHIGGSGSGAGVSVPGHPAGTVLSWFTAAIKDTKVPLSWLPDLETIGYYESAYNPNAINLWDSNAAAGDPSRGIMQTIMSTFLRYHQAGTSYNIYDPIANIAAGINYIKARYGNPGNTPGIISLSHGGKYLGYDSGGWLMPGTVPVNRTGRPEAVLTPEESAAFIAIAKRLTAGGGLGGATFNYFGTQQPTPEQRAMMMRDLGLTLSGVGG